MLVSNKLFIDSLGCCDWGICYKFRKLRKIWKLAISLLTPTVKFWSFLKFWFYNVFSFMIWRNKNNFDQNFPIFYTGSFKWSDLAPWNFLKMCHIDVYQFILKMLAIFDCIKWTINVIMPQSYRTEDLSCMGYYYICVAYELE